MSISTRYRRVAPVLAILVIATLVTTVLAIAGDSARDRPDSAARSADDELAYLLVKLEKRTRQVVAGHYGRPQPGGAEETAAYREFLIQNRILPAAVADPIFADVVPDATGGRAWVKMVVPEPRNPNNQGDPTALAMFSEMRNGGDPVWRRDKTARYYGEPIRAKAGCLPCHGEPAGDPDPHFPRYKKNGWKDGEVVGAVIARVASRK